MKIIVVVLEVNLIKNHEQWFVDTYATRHACIENIILSICKEVVGEYLYMRNLSIFKVLGVGKAILKMTLKKPLTLNIMLHVVNIKMDLIFGSLLRKK